MAFAVPEISEATKGLPNHQKLTLKQPETCNKSVIAW